MPTEYAIRFDFPEMNGGPWFAARRKDGLGVTARLTDAMLFDTEDEAELLLANGYGPHTRSCGTVVEVGH